MELIYAFFCFLSSASWTLSRDCIQVWSWFAIIMEVKLNMGVNPGEQKSTQILWEPNQLCMPSSESISSWIAHKLYLIEKVAPSLPPVICIHVHQVRLSLKSRKYYVPHCEHTMVPNSIQLGGFNTSWLPYFYKYEYFETRQLETNILGGLYYLGENFLVASQKMRKWCP